MKHAEVDEKASPVILISSWFSCETEGTEASAVYPTLDLMNLIQRKGSTMRKASLSQWILKVFNIQKR